MPCTSARDGGTTGSPSVHPRAKHNSICSDTLIGVHTSAAGSNVSRPEGCALVNVMTGRNWTESVSARLSLMQQVNDVLDKCGGSLVHLRFAQACERMRHHD